MWTRYVDNVTLLRGNAANSARKKQNGRNSKKNHVNNKFTIYAYDIHCIIRQIVLNYPRLMCDEAGGCGSVTASMAGAHVGNFRGVCPTNGRQRILNGEQTVGSSMRLQADVYKLGAKARTARDPVDLLTKHRSRNRRMYPEGRAKCAAKAVKWEKDCCPNFFQT